MIIIKHGEVLVSHSTLSGCPTYEPVTVMLGVVDEVNKVLLLLSSDSLRGELHPVTRAVALAEDGRLSSLTINYDRLIENHLPVLYDELYVMCSPSERLTANFLTAYLNKGNTVKALCEVLHAQGAIGFTFFRLDALKKQLADAELVTLNTKLHTE